MFDFNCFTRIDVSTINFSSKSTITTPASKSISSHTMLSSLKKRKNKENINLHTNDDGSSNSIEYRRKYHDHEKLYFIFIMNS